MLERVHTPLAMAPSGVTHIIRDPYIHKEPSIHCVPRGVYLWRNYVPADIGTSPFIPWCFMAAACEWESMKQMLQITRYTTTLEASRRPV